MLTSVRVETLKVVLRSKSSAIMTTQCGREHRVVDSRIGRALSMAPSILRRLVGAEHHSRARSMDCSAAAISRGPTEPFNMP